MGLSSADVCRLAGVTYRQLDYWHRMGLYPDQPRPRGSGIARTWSPRHVAVTALWGCLYRLGADYSTAVTLAEWAAELSGPWEGLLVVTPSPAAAHRQLGPVPELDGGAGWVIDLSWCWGRVPAVQDELALV